MLPLTLQIKTRLGKSAIVTFLFTYGSCERKKYLDTITMKLVKLAKP